MKALFLDVDGVLNNHAKHADSGICGIDAHCIDHLNHVIRQTDCRLVISSAWRYMVLGESMRLGGFQYLLRTHGLLWLRDDYSPIIGILDFDPESRPPYHRGALARRWLDKHLEVKHYAAVDDLSDEEPDFLGYGQFGIQLVQTFGMNGMTGSDAERLIDILVRK